MTSCNNSMSSVLGGGSSLGSSARIKAEPFRNLVSSEFPSAKPAFTSCWSLFSLPSSSSAIKWLTNPMLDFSTSASNKLGSMLGSAATWCLMAFMAKSMQAPHNKPETGLILTPSTMISRTLRDPTEPTLATTPTASPPASTQRVLTMLRKACAKSPWEAWTPKATRSVPGNISANFVKAPSALPASRQFWRRSSARKASSWWPLPSR
mmetsp:Transcript_24765/g.70697  ORF Transcript_24765/g.70697 Transcript_24765/m.70697 type:complete len:208 (+) Transcript_24765:1026-1649(+)